MSRTGEIHESRSCQSAVMCSLFTTTSTAPLESFSDRFVVYYTIEYLQKNKCKM